MQVKEKIIDVDVSQEMNTSFLEYSYSVIYARALPDARDGLKPVQRRILFQMSQMGLTPEKGHVKSSRVVGEVMGRLHPHGDSAIYDAMVRLAQDFTLRLPMVDGHGNFGSPDDGPAAARYTEVRMAPPAQAMTASLNENVVDMVPNYDNTMLQPEVLPAAIPNLLVNGSSGIAVGMATNMPPHNLGEVIAGARHLLMNPQADLEELMRFIPGPDLPGGGRIVGLEGIRQAYATGRGKFVTRATAHIENVTARKKGIVFTELPYMVGPEKVIEKIKDGVQSKKLQGISDVQNLTDRNHGLRLVVEVKNSFHPEAVLAALYRHTPLEESFGINNVALVDGQPRLLGLRQLLEVYLEHRLSVTRRRTEFRLAKAEKRLHLVEGLLTAIANIDEVIEIIRSSQDSAAASARLAERFALTHEQCEYLLELRLRRLTKFSRIELETEHKELKSEISRLNEILHSPQALRDLVSAELLETAEKYGTGRRTALLESDTGETKTPKTLKIEDDPCLVIYSATGLIARIADDRPLPRAGTRVKHDALRGVVKTTNLSEFGVLTSDGQVFSLRAIDVPAIPATENAPGLGAGAPLDELLLLPAHTRIVDIIALDGSRAPLAIATAQGKIKRVQPGYPARTPFEIIRLNPGDEIVGAAPAADTDVIVLITDDARLLRFSADAVRPQGRAGRGIAGITLNPGARVIAFNTVPADDLGSQMAVTVATASSVLPGTVPGTVKVTPLDRYPAKGRATGGVRTHRFLRGEDRLSLAYIGPDPVRAVTSSGVPAELPAPDERRDASGAPAKGIIAALG